MLDYEKPPHLAPGTIERQVVPELVKPYARTAFHALRGAWARLRVRMPRRVPEPSPPIFLIGCGRSGTTLLGELFAAHPELSYVHEPYHLWAAVEPMTDFLQLYAHGRHHCLLAEEMVTPESRRRFNCLFSAKLGSTLVEKSPINAMRIGYLNAVSPEATFVHIVRDGVEVARSIERMALTTRRMAFRPPRNAWWGVGEVKWRALIRDGQAAGYYPDEVGELTTDVQLGAYEWLVSILEVDAWRGQVGAATRRVALPGPDRSACKDAEVVGGIPLADLSGRVDRASRGPGPTGQVLAGRRGAQVASADVRRLQRSGNCVQF